MRTPLHLLFIRVSHGAAAVVGLGGIGLLVGGLPAGWLLDKLPGHAVIASATTLQVRQLCNNIAAMGGMHAGRPVWRAVLRLSWAPVMSVVWIAVLDTVD